MNKKKELQRRLRALIAEGDALHAKESLTEEEVKRAEAIGTEMTEVEEGIKEVETQMAEQERRRQDFQERRRLLTEPERPAEDGNTPPEERSDYSRWPVEEANQFFRAVRSFGQTRQLPAEMNDDLREAFTRAITGQGTLVDADGGFLVPTTISQTILRKMHEEGQILSRVQQVPVTVGNSVAWNAVTEDARTTGNRYGGISVSRTAEGGEKIGSKAKFQRVKLELKKMTALVYLTDEMIEDGPQVLTVVNDLVPRALTFATEREIVEGLGATEMEGILTTPALVTVSKETGQSAGSVLFENISKMRNRIVASSRSNYVWLIHQDVEPQLEKMYLAIGTAGVPVYMPANGLSGQPYSTLYGRPVVLCEHCATAGTVGDIIAADLSQYLYITKGGLQTAQSIHVRFVYDETALRFVLRNDGKSWWPAPLTPAKGSNTVSPFVALQTRA